MRSMSFIKPKELEVIQLANGITELNFAQNIEETADGSYMFDFYSVAVPSRPNLIEDAENNFENWLLFAIQ